MGFGAVQTLVGVTKLSELGIDVSKNWLTHLIKNLGDPVSAQDAATKAYLLAQLLNYLPLAGGTMSGAIAMGTKKITGLGTPTADQDSATKKYVDDNVGVVWNLAPTFYEIPDERDFDGIYQNTGTKTRIVQIVCASGFESSTIGTNRYAYAYLLVGATTPPTDYHDGGGLDSFYFIGTLPLPDLKFGGEFSLLALVPAGYYYKLTKSVTDGCSLEINSWTEFNL